MSSPYPLEQQGELEGFTPWDPTREPRAPGFFSGMGFSEDTAYLGPLYRALEGAGQGAAKGEELLAGAWHGTMAGYERLAQATGSEYLKGDAARGLAEAEAVEQDARQRVKALTPDAATTGAATGILTGLTSGLTRIAIGSLAGGTAGGAALLGSSEAASRYQELREQGVAPGAAATSAGVAGVTSAAGALLPAGFGTSLIGKILTGSAGNVGFGLASRYADHKVLELAGYPQQADQQKVWDTTSMIADLVLGGAFGALAHVHGPEAQQPAQIPNQVQALENRLGRGAPAAEDAALTAALAARDRQAAPGVPVDPAAASAHQLALETAQEQILQGEPVDVAGTGVENATFAARPEPERPAALELFTKALKESGALEEEQNLRDLEEALGARLRGEPAPQQTPRETPAQPTTPWRVDRAPEGTLSPEDREIEGRFADALEADYQGMKAKYAALPGTDGGKILSVDTARELSPDYLADRTKSEAAHEPGSSFVKRLYAEQLAQAPAAGQDPVVLFTAGGTGAGKTTAISNALHAEEQRAQIVYDTNMNGERSSISKIDQALAAGKEVKIAYVHREPVDALVNGALPRAMKQERKFGSGRTVPIESHIETHVGANSTVRKIAEHYASDSRVSMRIVDNSRGPGRAQLIELEQLPRLDYNRTREQAVEALEKARSEGRISEPVYRGFRGREQPAAGNAAAATAAEHAPPGATAAGTEGLGPGAHGQPQPERAAGRADQLGRVVTATGRSIEVRPRLAELKDLLTSDQEGYPKELQPRQRGARAALTEQVRSIARNLNPELLGNAPEADRGAPIVDEGKVVESGNGRVFALREAYENHPERAAAYRSYLEGQGYDTKGMKQPVLVRERVTPLSARERRAFTVEANQTSVAALSPVERAQADARILDSGVLSQLRPGEIATAQNAPFVRSYLEHLPEAERNALMNPDGTVSQEGVRRVQAAILAKAYGGKPESNAVLGRMLESTDNDLRSTMGALLDAGPAYARLRQAIEDGKVGPEYDLSGALTRAIEDTVKARESGQAIGEFLKQGDLLTKRAPVVEALMKALYDKKGERIAARERVAQTLMNYADRALKQRLDQGMLFGDAPLAPERLLARGADEKGEVGTETRPPQTDMFGLRTKQGTAPAGDAATQIAHQALERSPNIEIADENGEAQRGRSELMSAEEQVQTGGARTPDALSIAANCFGQRAA